MTSVTSPQQTDRRGTDEIPGPRGGQGVRLLVLGADPDAQTLRERATAAGYELAQRYSARVSHVAYGPGVDPGDARYTKIRDAGLVPLPLQKCAEELGLGGGSADAMDTEAEAETEADAVTGSGTAADVEAQVEGGITAEITAEPEYGADDAPLEIPPLHPVAETTEVAGAADVVEAIVEESVEVEFAAPVEVEESVELAEPVEAEPELADDVSATAFVPGFADEADKADDAAGVPLAAAVIGLDPWVGGGVEEDAEAGEIPHSEAPIAAHDQAALPTRPAGHVLFSILWALIPFATFGLLSPVTFGYAAYRLRSRALVLTALGYTMAVVASFVLSAVRPHSATPSDAAGALLTLCLAGTWIGGTLHAVSIRTRVFAR